MRYEDTLYAPMSYRLDIHYLRIPISNRIALSRLTVIFLSRNAPSEVPYKMFKPPHWAYSCVSMIGWGRQLFLFYIQNQVICAEIIKVSYSDLRFRLFFGFSLSAFRIVMDIIENGKNASL